MSYRARETKIIDELSNKMKDRKIMIGKATGAVRFFWLDDHLEVEEKLWHPVIIVKYLIALVLHIPILIVAGNGTTLFGFNSFRSSQHPTAKRLIDKKEIEDAIKKDKILRETELAKHQWV